MDADEVAAPVTFEGLDAAEFSRCWDLVVASQRAAGWHPPPLFTLAELGARFGFGHPHPPDALCPGEVEAYTCAIGKFGAPLLWQGRDLGPAAAGAAQPGPAPGSPSVLVRRVVVADAVYPTGVAQHRWLLTAECGPLRRTAGGAVQVPRPHWQVSRTRLRWLGFTNVTVAQRWRPLPSTAASGAPVDRFGVAAALCFSNHDTVVVFGQRPAALLSELVDVPFVSRYGPTAASEQAPPAPT